MEENKTKDLIRKMFEKQDELNIHTNSANWRNNTNLKWYRAIWTECAELIDYTNWKWWRKQDISIDDIKIEIIDIWHFIMSDLMTMYSIDSCVDNIYCKFKNGFESFPETNIQKLQERAEELARDCLNSRQFLIYNFIQLCGAVGSQMNVPGIYKLYMGKNILNRFRQDNGYKQKTYQKIWNGKEDNVYLMMYLDEIEEIDDNFEEEIYKKLQKQYSEIISKINN